MDAAVTHISNHITLKNSVQDGVLELEGRLHPVETQFLLLLMNVITFFISVLYHYIDLIN